MSTGPLPVRRVKSAWTDPDHMRLVYDLEERRNHRPAERVKGMDPDDPWADGHDDDLPLWRRWARAGHLARGCPGWTQQDGTLTCECGEEVPA